MGINTMTNGVFTINAGMYSQLYKHNAQDA